MDYSFIFLVLFLTAIMALIYYVMQADKKKHIERQQLEQRRLDTYLKELVVSGERLEKGDIPEIDSEIGLKRGETLHVVLRNIQLVRIQESENRSNLRSRCNWKDQTGKRIVLPPWNRTDESRNYGSAVGD
jgi:hypothetical protein